MVLHSQAVELWLERARCPACKNEIVSSLEESVARNQRRECACGMAFEEAQMLDKQFSHCQELQVLECDF